MTDTGFTNSKFVKTTEKLFLKVTPSIYLAPLTGKGNFFYFGIFLGEFIFLFIAYGIISLLAIFGNSLVIWIVFTKKTMQDVVNGYVSNLAISDVILAMFCIPFQSYAALVQRWDLPEFMCKFCPFVQTMSINVNICALLAIALER